MLGSHCDRHRILAINQQAEKLKYRELLIEQWILHLGIKCAAPRVPFTSSSTARSMFFFHSNVTLIYIMRTFTSILKFFCAVKGQKMFLFIFNPGDNTVALHNCCSKPPGISSGHQPVWWKRNNDCESISPDVCKWGRQRAERKGN